MQDAAVSPFILKMNEPGFALVRFDPSPLMRPVDGCSALLENDFVFVGTQDIF